MTSEAMSPLRRRMIEDMTVRNFVEKTQKDYIRYVKDLTGFLGRSPDTATAEDLRRYQLHLTNSGVHPPRINAPVSSLRFFFSVTLDRAEVSRLLTFVAHPRKIPIVLSPEEVVRFLEAAPMSPSGLCRVTRKRVGVSSEISDQVGRRSYQLPKIVLSGYRRATGGSVEC